MLKLGVHGFIIIFGRLIIPPQSRAGVQGYVFGCDNLHYGFFVVDFFNPVACVCFIIVSLNAFDIARIFVLISEP